MADPKHLEIDIDKSSSGRHRVTLTMQATSPGQYMQADLSDGCFTLANAKNVARHYLHRVIADAALALQELER